MTFIKRYLIFIAYAGFIAVAISGGALNVAWLFIQNEFELPLSAVGLLLSLPAIARLIISFYSGRLITRFGVGYVLLIGSLLVVIGMIGFAFTPTWNFLVFASIVMGIGNSGIINGLNTFVASNYASSRMNWLHASFGLGATLGPILISLIVLDLNLSWRVGYGVMALLTAMFALVILMSLKYWLLPTVDRKEKPKATSPTTEMGPSSSGVVVWLGVALMVVSAGIETTTGQLSNNLFVDGRGYDPRIVATWISVYWFSFTLGRFLSGVIIDRIDHNRFLRLTILISIVGASLIWLKPSPELSFFGLAVIGFAMAPLAPTIMGDTPRRVGINRAPNMIGYQSTGAGLGIAILPSLAGVLADVIDLEVIGFFLVVLTIVMFIFHEVMIFQEAMDERVEHGIDQTS